MGYRLRLIACLTCVIATASDGAPLRAQTNAAPGPLVPTVGPTVPRDLSSVWWVPGAAARSAASGYQPIVRAIRALEKDRPAEALQALPPKALAGTPLADYAAYYRGVALAALDRPSEAAAAFATLLASKPTGYLAEAVPQRAAELAERQPDNSAAHGLYDLVPAEKSAAPDVLLMRKATVAKRAGLREEALTAWRSVFYDYPLSDLAASAAEEITKLDENPLRPAAKERRALAFRRARQLFAARRYAEARIAFENLRWDLESDEQAVADLRIAECLFHLKQYPQARTALGSWPQGGEHQAEAQFYYASVLRELRDTAGFIAAARALVAAHPDSPWSEEALNALATHYILVDADEQALDVFREQFRKFPGGARAERAAWKVGWAAYRAGDDREAIEVFELAARMFPRGDMRPAWVYWAARAHDRSGDRGTAVGRYRLVVTDYLNSYYGRLAVARLKALGQAPAPLDVAADASATASAPATALDSPPTESLIRALLSLELYDAALNELEYARRVWGSSAPVVATIGWVHNKRGDLLRGTQSAKRAYPQFVAAGAEAFPDELRRVFFPIEHWELIKRHSTANSLDPYLVAALIAQESGYDASAKSVANAYGLMQILPSTGRRLARTLGIKRFSTPMLLRPDINIRMGTLYFAQLVKQFGGRVHLALASYNAGATPARRWLNEKGTLEREVFIDDIPYPETQSYVKRILSGSEEYRNIYGRSSQTVADNQGDAAEDP